MSLSNLLVISEILFVLLPFVVIGIILIYKNEIARIIFIPEWSLATAILTGQTIVKLVSGLLVYDLEVCWQRTALMLTLLVVVLLVPSLIFLTIVILGENLPIWLAISQIVLFLLSTVAFYLFGGIGEYLVSGEKPPVRWTVGGS